MSASWKLFLDDIRNPVYSGFTIARNYTEAVKLMEELGCPEFIAFDHDLAEDHYAPIDPRYVKPSMAKTGYDLAHWLVYKDIESMGKFIPDNFKFHVHSMNPVGKENIEKLLNSYLDFKREENCRKACSF